MELISSNKFRVNPRIRSERPEVDNCVLCWASLNVPAHHMLVSFSLLRSVTGRCAVQVRDRGLGIKMAELCTSMMAIFNKIVQFEYIIPGSSPLREYPGVRLTVATSEILTQHLSIYETMY
jgi:hypothetical protein